MNAASSVKGLEFGNSYLPGPQIIVILFGCDGDIVLALS